MIGCVCVCARARVRDKVAPESQPPPLPTIPTCGRQLFAAAVFRRFPAAAAADYLLPALAEYDRASYQARGGGGGGGGW